MKYLILGGQGFIGTNLVDMIRRHNTGAEIVVADDYTNHNAWYYGCKMRDVALVSADLRVTMAARLLVEEHKPDAIVHLAGNTRVMESIRKPETFILENHGIDLNVAVHVPPGVPVIYASTLGALFSSSSAGVYFREENAISPVTPYGAAKAAGEALFRTYSNLIGFPLGILRFTNVYGPWSYHKESVLHRWFKVATMPWNQEVAIIKDPNHWRDFIYVADVCRAILAVLQLLNNGGPNMTALYHIGSGVSMPMDRVAKTFAATVGNIQMTPGRSHEMEATCVGANVDRMKGELGILPIRMEEGLKKTHRWYLALAGAAERESKGYANG